jgi:hypothetical protein
MRQRSKPIQASVLHVSRERYRSQDKGLPHLPRIQEEDDPKAEPTTKSNLHQRNQPHIPLAPNIAIIILKSTFVSTPQFSFRIPIQLLQTPPAKLPTIQLRSPHKPNSQSLTHHHLPSATVAINIPHIKLPNNLAKIRA